MVKDILDCFFFLVLSGEKHLQKQVQRLNNDKIYCMFQVGFGSNKIQSTGIVILKKLMYCSERFYFLKYNLFSCTLLILENYRQFLIHMLGTGMHLYFILDFLSSPGTGTTIYA